jgi:hypothetical protein
MGRKWRLNCGVRTESRQLHIGLLLFVQSLGCANLPPAEDPTDEGRRGAEQAPADEDISGRLERIAQAVSAREQAGTLLASREELVHIESEDRRIRQEYYPFKKRLPEAQQQVAALEKFAERVISREPVLESTESAMTRLEDAYAQVRPAFDRWHRTNINKPCVGTFAEKSVEWQSKFQIPDAPSELDVVCGVSEFYWLSVKALENYTGKGRWDGPDSPSPNTPAELDAIVRRSLAAVDKLHANQADVHLDQEREKLHRELAAPSDCMRKASPPDAFVGNQCVQAGLSAQAAGDGINARKYFERGCQLQVATGCRLRALIDGESEHGKITWMQKACHGNDDEACNYDNACMQVLGERPQFGQCSAKGECQVVGSTTYSSGQACEDLCNRGLPGACVDFQELGTL